MIRQPRRWQLRRSMLSLHPLEDRSVPSSVQGTVFEDANHNQLFDLGETGLAGWTVYVDNNANSIIDVGDVTTVSDVNGSYFIDTSSIPTNGVRHYVGLDLQVGSGGRWVNDTPTQVFAYPATEPSAIRDFGVHFQPYLSVEPIGPETMVNVATAGSQSLPDVAANATGNYVAAWYTGQSGNPIQARVFNADGTPQTGEISVTSAGGSLFHVAMADTGRFVVAWQNGQVYARLFNANGTPATGAITVAAGSGANGTVLIEDVAMDSAGNFAVLYASWKGTVRPQDHYVKRYTAAGATNGNAMKVMASLIWLQSRKNLAMDATGRFVVAWDDFDGDTVVRAQRFSAAGQKVGSPITVATGPAGAQIWQSNVSMNDAGRFAVTWAGLNSGLAMGRVYDWGTPVGGTLTLGTTGVAVGCDVDAANNVTFAWASAGDVRFRRLTGGGVLEPESIVNTTTQGQQGSLDGYQSVPVGVAATGNDQFVVVWPGYGPGDDQGIFMQRFGLPSAPRPDNGGSLPALIPTSLSKMPFIFSAMTDDDEPSDFAANWWGVDLLP